MKHASRMLTLSVAGVIALSLGACTNGIHDQVVGGSALLGEPKVGALSTTASYRSVVAKFDGEAGTKVCPEPPPDVAVAVTSSLLAQLEGGKGDAKASATLAKSVAEKIAPLLKRTSALQLYRDGRSYNCFAHMNDAIDAEAYEEANNELMQSVTFLMAIENLKGTDPTLPPGVETEINTAIQEKVAEMIRAAFGDPPQIGIEAKPLPNPAGSSGN